MPHDTIEQHTALTREFFAYANVAADTPMQRASALIAAATVIIEMDVGQGHAPAALMALVEPTILEWTKAARSRRP